VTSTIRCQYDTCTLKPSQSHR